jgi:hypothetical protein
MTNDTHKTSFLNQLFSADGENIFEIPQLGMRLHRWSVETMLAGLFGDLYFGDTIKNMVHITHKCKYLEKEIACLKMIKIRVN